ncbi:MAG: ABC transporter ATP-binding protein [Candidatus Electrothrix sp. EH2]|nr:ABC transporter ATP-binding protein [Candidatus Electrothrix sp. EH2]
MKALLELAHIYKTYEKKESGRRQILHDVSLSVAPGEAVALTGPSGSGKSTLARIASGFEKPDSGNVLFMENPVSGPDRSAGRRYFSQVQMIWQDPKVYLNPYLPVLTLITEPMLAQGGHSKSVCRKRAYHLMEALGLDTSLENLKPGGLSGGQCQRIALARALSVSPRLLICDEALVSLDLVRQARTIRLLKGLREKDGLSLLFITHDRAGAGILCQRRFHLDQGSIREYSSV